MAKYLFQASYTATGTKRLAAEGGSSRREQVASMMRDMGGQPDSFYYALGSTDVFGIADIPDNITAAAISSAINSSGAVTTKVVVLLTPEEMDEASKKTVTYRAPGG